MIYLSLTNEKEKKYITKIINELHINTKVYDKSNYKKYNLKKSKIVICDYNLEKIKKYLLKKKIVIVYLNNYKDDKLTNLKNVYTYNTNDELKMILKCVINSLEKLHRLKKISNLLIFTLLFSIFVPSISYKYLHNNESKKLNIINETTKKKNAEEIENEKRKKFNIKKENIVFFGDSITDYYDLKKYYKNIPVINSGTAGYQTKDLLKEIDKSVVQYNPTKVFLLIGTNDIAFTKLNDENIADNIIEIAKKIKEKRPKTQIYIESIYPVSKENNDLINLEMVNVRENKRIKNINNLVKVMCEKEDYNYINLYDLLVNKDDNLTLEYTADGLHMSEKVYKFITKELLKYIYEEK